MAALLWPHCNKSLPSPMMMAMPQQRLFLIPLIVASALFMENLDAAVLATSLPAIGQSLNENPLTLNLAITSYLLSLAIFIPASGWAADRFGARGVFQAAIVVFTLGSIACGLSQTLWQLVAGRIIQGLGGAMMVPVGRLVILRTVEKSQIVQAMAYLTVPALLGPVIGAPLGGFITTYANWRWIFWINVPIGLLGLYLAWRFIPDLKEENPHPLDVRGFFLSGIGLAGLIFGFEMTGRGIAPAWLVTGLMGLGALCLLAYVLHAKSRAQPLIDLSLLRIATFRASIVGGLVFRVGIGAIPFLAPLMLQMGFGLTPFESGLITFTGALGAITMKFLAKPILKRFGFRQVLLWNALFCGLSVAAIGLFQATTPTFVMISVMLGGGIIRSLHFSSINAIAYADLGKERLSKATSFAAMAQQLSLSIGVGVGASVLYFTVGVSGQPTAEDFLPAFLVVGALTALSGLCFLRLPQNAGAEISGRHPTAKFKP